MKTYDRWCAATITWAMDILSGRLRPTAARREGERGDVPGWVLITIMTAGLVTLLWGIAGDSFQRMFTSALDAVTGPR